MTIRFTDIKMSIEGKRMNEQKNVWMSKRMYERENLRKSLEKMTNNEENDRK